MFTGHDHDPLSSLTLLIYYTTLICQLFSFKFCIYLVENFQFTVVSSQFCCKLENYMCFFKKGSSCIKSVIAQNMHKNRGVRPLLKTARTHGTNV